MYLYIYLISKRECKKEENIKTVGDVVITTTGILLEEKKSLLF